MSFDVISEYLELFEKLIKILFFNSISLWFYTSTKSTCKKDYACKEKTDTSLAACF